MVKKILLIEDDIYLSTIYATKIRKAKYEVIVAETGQDGLDKIKSEKPALILLDIMLPGGMDGLEVLKKIKEDAVMNTLPVMLLTNIKDEKTIGEGLRLGAIAYFIKTTTNPGDIIKNIENFI